MMRGNLVAVVLAMIACAALPGCGGQTSTDDNWQDASSDVGSSPSIRATGMLMTARSTDGRYEIEAQAVEVDTLPVSEPFDMVVRFLGKKKPDTLTLRFDAAMPHHGHGMNVVPVTTKQADGSFLVEGIVLHMGGRWELYFDIDEGGLTERVQHVVMIE